MDFFSYIMGKSHGGGGNAGGGSGGGSSNYDGVLCYDTTKTIEVIEFDGARTIKVSNTVPDVVGKKCFLACIDYTGAQSLIDLGEVNYLEEVGPDDELIKLIMVFANDQIAVVVVTEEQESFYMMSAGVWVDYRLNALPTSFVIFK